MQLGLTWPLQRLLRCGVPYGEPAPRLFCWDAHCITLQGRSSLLLVHCASRYTCVRYDMTTADWSSLAQIVAEEIEQGLADAGIAAQTRARYLAAAGEVCLTRTHGRREVAFLNRAWDDAAAADLLVDRAQQRQPMLNAAVNSCRCRCAAYPEQGTALEFLHRCFTEERI